MWNVNSIVNPKNEFLKKLVLRMTFSDIIILLEPNKEVSINNYKSCSALPLNNKLYLQVLTKEWMKIIQESDKNESDFILLKCFNSKTHFYLLAVYLHPLDSNRRINVLNMIERYIFDDLKDEQLIIAGDFNYDLNTNKKYTKDEQKQFQNISKATDRDITSDHTWILGGDEFKDKKTLIDYV